MLQLLGFAGPGSPQLAHIVGPRRQSLVNGRMRSKVDNLLPDLPGFAVGAHGLMVGAVLLSLSLYVDGSYVDVGSPLCSIYY
jgi:hypothetical protein